ncbi:unnamed protein product [Mytilus edulis]|uniref:Uncharacterized protein n=1 Tax=Mytilus edulis TaxID=6550 RepID=A0A8S3VI73_MYTED|nr:unnamed protein product [Mytilus edulis]
MSTENKKEKTISVSKDLISRIKGDKTSGAVNYNKNINDKSNNSVHENKKGQKTSDYVQIGPTYGAGKKYPMSSHGYIVPLNDKTIVPANPNKQEIGNKIAKNEKDIIQMFKSELDVIGKKQTQKKKSNTDNNVRTSDSTASINNNNNNNGNFPGNNRPFNINRNNGNNNDNNNQWQTQNRNNGNNNNPNNVSRLQSMSQPSSQRTRKNGRSFPNESSRNQRRRRKKKVGTTMSPHDMAEEMFGTSEVDPVILEMLAKSNKNKFQL